MRSRSGLIWQWHSSGNPGRGIFDEDLVSSARPTSHRHSCPVPRKSRLESLQVGAMATEETIMVASYNPRLVALSVSISILAAYAARDLSERVRDARGRAWLAWLVGGST